MSDTAFTMSIDDAVVIAESGQTVMQVARDNGIDIPSLFDSPHLNAFGSCRICVVEIDGVRGTPSSCTTPVSPGMNVATNRIDYGNCVEESQNYMSVSIHWIV